MHFCRCRHASAACLSFGGGVAIADRQVSISRHAWELACTGTSASPGNLLWLWLCRMHHFSTSVICCYSFGACEQLRGKRLCTAWALHACPCLSISSSAQGHHVVVTCALCAGVECSAFPSGSIMAWACRGCMVWEQHCRTLWSPENASSKSSGVAGVALLPGLCNQHLSVVLSEVKFRSFNFYWSVAHHKLLILIEQSPPVQQAGDVPVDQTWWRIFWSLSFLWAKDHCRWEEISCTNAGFRFAFSYVLSLHTDFGRS